MRDAHRDWAARWRVPIGFAMAAVYFYLARPTPGLLAAGAVIAGIGIGLRAASAGYLRKGEAVARGGPYAYVRHPLYLGSAFIAFGFAVAGGRALLGALLVTVFVALHVPALLRDEREMRTRFPGEYAAYAAAVPRLFPRARPGFDRSGERFSGDLYWRNREYKALAGYLAALLLLYWRMRYGS